MTTENTHEMVNQACLKFIEEAVETETVYLLMSEDNCLQTDSTEYVGENEEPLVAIPVWTKSYVEEGTTWAGEEAKPEEMSLDIFVNSFVPQLEEANCTIGLNWDKEGIGREFTPLDLTDILVRKINGEAVELPEQPVEILES